MADLGSAGADAAAGATAGAALGPWGAAAGGIIGGVAGLIGGEQTNAANAQQAAQNNYLNTVFQLESQAYNANQAQMSRDFESQTIQQQIDQQNKMFNAAADYNTQSQARQQYYNQTNMAQQETYDWANMQNVQAYNTNMANTAYQRSVADMKAAGLNPILGVASGGAATPSLSTPTVQSQAISAPTMSTPGNISIAGNTAASSGISHGVMATMQDAITPAVKTAFQGAQLTSTLDSMRASINNADADTKSKIAQAANYLASANKTAGVDTQVSQAQLQALLQQPELTRDQAQAAIASAAASRAAAGASSAQAILSGANAAKVTQDRIMDATYGRGGWGDKASTVDVLGAPVAGALNDANSAVNAAGGTVNRTLHDVFNKAGQWIGLTE